MPARLIQSLLIANRGEIACRVIRTARSMGIRTVAVHSDADAKALHVRQADEAVHIGASPAAESYLRGDRIIEAALASGAEAIHPGYGFLSENADFAQAVIDAGLVWVGPRPASIRAMGLKDAAKKLMAEAGVPVTPGYLGENQDAALLAAEAQKIGYPVLIKAVAGGGGKGMRLVEKAADFADALASCQREAASSFGNDRVLIEKYIASPRHIEVQVFGDTHGNLVHLFERDCSLQRRHQKVIEEAPAPGMDAATREALCCAALRAAKAVDYVGAGTVEFIADGSGALDADKIWFMEMNTRLQVEHPVTEEITGVDLVEWQLRVASGEALPLKQEELSINGWAMEARLYAEDPAKGFLPSTGRLEHFDLGEAGRLETGVEENDEISPHYDPMIAKLVAHGNDREAARSCLLEMIRSVWILPVKSNAAFLASCLTDPEFMGADLDTGLIARRANALTEVSISDEALAAGTLLFMEPNLPTKMQAPLIDRAGQLGWAPDGQNDFNSMFGFRLNQPPHRSIRLSVDGEAKTVDLDRIGVQKADEWTWRKHGVWVQKGNDLSHYFASAVRVSGGHHSASDGAILAPMPGTITSVEVSAGDTVAKGQKLLTMEAMKMEHTLTAPFDGTVAELAVSLGQQVQVEALLARIESTD